MSFPCATTPVSGFLSRPLDSSAPVSSLLLLCESLLCILAKRVCSAASAGSAQQGTEREWGLNALAQVLDVQFFSLFMWPDVHPRSQLLLRHSWARFGAPSEDAVCAS